MMLNWNFQRGGGGETQTKNYLVECCFLELHIPDACCVPSLLVFYKQNNVSE